MGFDSKVIVALTIIKRDKDSRKSIGTMTMRHLTLVLVLLHLPGMEIVNVYDRQCEAIFGSLQLADADNDQQQR